MKGLCAERHVKIGMDGTHFTGETTPRDILPRRSTFLHESVLSFDLLVSSFVYGSLYYTRSSVVVVDRDVTH